MRQESTFNRRRFNRSQQQHDINSRSPLPAGFLNGISKVMATTPRHTIVGSLLITALLAFELFNFDTTQYALGDLLGETGFLNVRWATILAVAFCAIDFAGLAYLFGPDRDPQHQHETWYLMGAWLLGATMNALMTWWAVSLTLLDHQTGNAILSHEELLDIGPALVAVLVWVTRILFIGAFSIAGSRLFGIGSDTAQRSRPPLASEPQRSATSRQASTSSGGNGHTIAEGPGYMRGETQMPTTVAARATAANSRAKSSRNVTRVNRRSPQHVSWHRAPLATRSARSERQ